MTEEHFMDKFVFHELENRNDGFDAPSIRYFSEEDFETVMERIEELGIEIFGIECWVQKKFKRVKYREDYPRMEKWHRNAYKDMRREGYACYFSATYEVPPELLRQ